MGELQALKWVGESGKRNAPGVLGLQMYDTHRVGKRWMWSLEVPRIITNNTVLSTGHVSSSRQPPGLLSPVQAPANPGTVSHVPASHAVDAVAMHTG